MTDYSNQGSEHSPDPAKPPLQSRTSLAPGERWYVVFSQPHREGRAQQQISAQGFRVFLPLYRKTVRHARKLTTKNAPFFPRYLFVALDLKRDQWLSVNGTFGVTTLVMDGATPRPVPHGVVEGLVQASEAGFVKLGQELKVGDAVRVLGGPFADLLGELVRIDGASRVRVLLKLLGGTVPASFDRRDLMPSAGYRSPHAAGESNPSTRPRTQSN